MKLDQVRERAPNFDIPFYSPVLCGGRVEFIGPWLEGKLHILHNDFRSAKGGR